MDEHHVGTVIRHAYGQETEKPVYCRGWRGGLYGKVMGSYAFNSLHNDGSLGNFHSWTDLVLFESWVRIPSKRLVAVQNTVQAAKERLSIG